MIVQPAETVADTKTFLDAISAALVRAGRHNPEDVSAPVAVLWPDGTREWEPLLDRLRVAVPMLTLGDYSRPTRSGPAHWIICMLERTLDDKLPYQPVPIVYLPGVSKTDLRAMEDCPTELQPVAALQFRCALFTQQNGKDWTVRAFIESNAGGGLGIPIAADGETRKAAHRSLAKLADAEVAALRAHSPLRAEFFNSLINPDQVRALLEWLNAPTKPDGDVEPEREAFRSMCKSRYGFDPETDGPLKGAALLGERTSSEWDLVWTRFTESPRSYPNIPDLLRRAKPKKAASGLFERPGAWPQDNEAREADLRTKLQAIANLLPYQARAAIVRVDADPDQGGRQLWVWAKLGRAPLASALEHLAALASATSKPLGGADLQGVANAYVESGWKADWAALQALASAQAPDDRPIVESVVKAVYVPWLTDAARAFQDLLGEHAANYRTEPLPDPEPGTVRVFIDSLRMDIAHRLASRLRDGGMSGEIGWRMTALPTVTSTAKPAVMPIASSLRSGPQLIPLGPTGAAADIAVLRKLLREAGCQVLDANDPVGDPTGRAWAEAGDLDEIGHMRGAGMAPHVEAALADVEHAIATFLHDGWQRVEVVTDHGFLVVPGGLPKAQLAEHLTVARKGRCARLKDGSSVDLDTAPWHWDPAVRFAFAPDIHCFELGKEYEHGGLSAQECVTPVLTVTPGRSANKVDLETVTWSGLRCRVSTTGSGSHLACDVRRGPASSESSVIGGSKNLDADGRASLLVTDEDLGGEQVYVVLLDSELRLVAQRSTLVGGD